MTLTTIGFDADDTLWHNEKFFRATQDDFLALMADYASSEQLQASLLAAERRNIGRYGFGIKGFTLSMIETAIEVSADQIPATVIGEIVAAGREMLAHPVELLPHAREAVTMAAKDHRVILITKGDLLDQERKLAQSGLSDLFHAVEIVTDKTPPIYAQLFARHGVESHRAMMVGNSLKSDIWPVLDLGGWAVHVPHGLVWALEHADPPQNHDRFHTVASLADLSDLVGTIQAAHNQ